MADHGDKEQFERWAIELHQQRRHRGHEAAGSLNHIDSAARSRAALSISSGVAVGLGRPLRDGPTVRRDESSAYRLDAFASDLGRPGFRIRTERVELDCHGPTNTHIDALNHLAYNGQWFGGRSMEEEPVASVTDLADYGIFTRGVHVDIPALRGEPYVQPDRPVTGEEIDAALSAAGLVFERGDALLLDCGRDRYEGALGADWGAREPKPGSGASVARWLAAHAPSLLCWDMMDALGPGEAGGAVHRMHWAIGLVLVDNCEFGRARELMDQRSQHAGALIVSPLRMEGATGCNVNPMLVL